MCNCIAARLPRYRSAEGRILICRAAYGLAAANPCHAVGVGISRSADRRRGKLPLLVIAIGRARRCRAARIEDLDQAAVAVVVAIIAIDQVARRVAVIDVVRQRRPVAAILIIAVVILFPRRRGLLCELSRGIVGIFICDVIILLFRRSVKLS